MEHIKNFEEFIEDNTIEFGFKPFQDEMYEMASVGFLTPKLEIYVNTNDGGDIPHFHIWDTTTRGDKFHTCIQIKDNKYFHHTGKEDFLNSKMRKYLIKFLQSNDEYGELNWKVLIKEWNRNNSNMKVDINTTMPDYSDIEDNR